MLCDYSLLEKIYGNTSEGKDRNRNREQGNKKGTKKAVKREPIDRYGISRVKFNKEEERLPNEKSEQRLSKIRKNRKRYVLKDLVLINYDRNQIFA